MIGIDLSDRTILITGGLGAIAAVVVRRLSEAGAFLAITDLADEAAGAARCVELGAKPGRHLYCRMDVTDEREVERVFADIFAARPTLDIALGLAGAGCGIHPFAATSSEEFERIFRLNYFGQVHLARAVLKRWTAASTRGHLIFTTSLVASLPWPEFSAYNSAKAAVEMLGKTLALEYAPHGIRINAVAPGHVATGASMAIYDTDEAYRAMVQRVIPMRQLIPADAIADAFLWLCSPLASAINGQVIKVDFGESLPKVG
jgi:NAD(P)-dependent dehydrogenase (short-subunit alcohol dehydrogenase family)